MINRVLLVSLLAGLVAGLFVATVQNFTTTPLILSAETFEHAMNAPGDPASSDHDHATMTAPAMEHDHGEGWKPAVGWQRIIATSTATIGAAVGFSALILAGMLFTGGVMNERIAWGWGFAGFLATGLAPALGLSPELPGMVAAELSARQTWWAATAVSSAAGLFLMLRPDQPEPPPIWQRVLALVLLMAPHVIGAPERAVHEASSVPPALAAKFAAASLTVQAMLWLSAATAVGMFWRMFDRGSSNRSALP